MSLRASVPGSVLSGGLRPMASVRRPRETRPPASSPRRRAGYSAPPEFEPDRTKPAGRHRLLEVFPGLERTVPFQKYPGTNREVLRAARETWAHLSEGPGWMYVAPRRTTPEVRAAGFRMVETNDDAIVVSQDYLRTGPPIDVYLDLIHEFLHILQRRQGRELWPARLPYADRPTEVEAYSFSVVEARRLGVPDAYLRKYLEVPWIGRRELRHLLQNVGVSPST